MNRRLLLLFVACAVLTLAEAQTVSWAVKPGTYDKIEHCWNDMFLVTKGSQSGVVMGDGRLVVPVGDGRLTGFYEGYALVLSPAGSKEKVVGILGADGTYNRVDGTYYTVPSKEFFSEELLVVTNQRGKGAYLNTMGKVEKQLDVELVSPFSEGFAAVGEKRDFRLIDRAFNPVRIQLGTVAPVYGGANPYKGTAVVWDGNGKFYYYSISSGQATPVRDSRKRRLESFDFDYDYLDCITLMSNRPTKVTYDEPTRPAMTLKAVAQNGKYGFVNGNKTVLPAQFDMADHFYGSHAIVKTNGGFGLLAMQQATANFEAEATSNISYRRSASRNLAHRFRVKVPAPWNIGDVSVSLTDRTGQPVSTTGSGGNYEFRADGSTGDCNYLVEVAADGLKLWTGIVTYHYNIEPEPVVVDEQTAVSETGNYKALTLTLAVTNKRADRDGRCYVKATVSNPNSQPVSTKVTITGSNLLETVSQRVTVPAYGTVDVTTYFTVKKAVMSQHVSATSSAGGSAELSGLQMIPFK